VIVLPTAAVEATGPAAVNALMTQVFEYLGPRLLLTTRAHVIQPFYLDVHVTAEVVLLPDQEDAARVVGGEIRDVRKTIADAVAAFLDPHHGGEDRTGWPFGRDVFASELYALLDELPEVDYVTKLTLTSTPPDRVRRVGPGNTGKLIGVSVKPYELVRAAIAPGDITVGAA
jgi:hypothetical protein